jgi:hypothetical protein
MTWHQAWLFAIRGVSKRRARNRAKIAFGDDFCETAGKQAFSLELHDLDFTDRDSDRSDLSLHGRNVSTDRCDLNPDQRDLNPDQRDPHLNFKLGSGLRFFDSPIEKVGWGCPLKTRIEESKNRRPDPGLTLKGKD